MNAIDRTTEAKPTELTRPWRCRSCGALLGMQQGGELHVKYKDVQHWISGRCRHACRRCGEMNTLHVGKEVAP